jgi:hypothetical protein
MILALVLAAACQGSDANGGSTGAATCAPGAMLGCMCPGGVASLQQCSADGMSYSPCACVGAAAAGVGVNAAGSSAAGTAAAADSGAGVGAAGVTGGMPDTGATDGGTGGGAGPEPTSLPTHKEPCPTFTNGQMTFLGTPVMVWAGPPSAANGPMVFYFHGTTGSAQEAPAGLGQAAINDVKTNGGVIASFGTNAGCSANCGSGQGTNTGNGVWFTGDFDVADEILACAIEQLHVDTRHIHVAGYSAGGLQSGSMAFLRSNYIASIGMYSGGASVKTPNPNPSNVPPMVGAHGDNAQDNLGKPTDDYATNTKNAGSLAIVCNDGKAHWDSVRFAVGPNIWQFFKDHPYGATPDAYGGVLPGGWPSYCQVW